MKSKIVGGLTGLLLGLSVVVVAPTMAHAASWTTYINGYSGVTSRPSSGAYTVHGDRGRIYPPADGAGYTQKFDVIENKTKGSIRASTSSATGLWVTLNVPSPKSNTKARCYLTGPPHPLGAHHLCDVRK